MEQSCIVLVFHKGKVELRPFLQIGTQVVGRLQGSYIGDRLPVPHLLVFLNRGSHY